ncbi:MAG: GNAT family N-acetyltransferase [Verrucomicrobia bacterium]|nr:GNAT family N-acetyltransferase [Cytophagales bacterium]
MKNDESSLEIIEFQPAFAINFKDLNEAWITTYFTLEEADRKALGNPQSYIIDKGGHILFASYENKMVGTCALIKTNEHTFELAKMAVTPQMQGKKIGYLLGQAAIAKAKEAGAEKLFLESNRKLKPAIHLYEKLGFVEKEMQSSPYARCDIYMELALNK